MEVLFNFIDHVKNLFGFRGKPVKVIQKYD